MKRVHLKRYQFFMLVLGAVVGMARPMVAQQGSTSEPVGWVGVMINTSVSDDGNGSATSYPVITDVTPESPADRAGLVTGDTILKYNAEDARTVQRFTQFLQPGRHIRVTVRRNGVRTVTVVVGRNPEVDTVAAAASPLSFIGGPVLGRILNRNALSLNTCLLTLTTGPVEPLEATSLAGASFSPMNADLAGILHVQNNGVLVLNVAPGTKARQAGLKGGDVILTVGTSPVNTPAALIQIVTKKAQQNNGAHLTLHVVRGGQARKITLGKT